MKKRWILTAAVLTAGVLLLTACGNSGSGQKSVSSGGSQNSGAGQPGSGNAQQPSNNGEQSADGDQNTGTVNPDQEYADPGNGGTFDEGGDGQDGNEFQGLADEPDPNDTFDLNNQSGEEQPLEFDDTVDYDDDDPDAGGNQDGSYEDGWEGVYLADGGETVTITTIDDGSFSFVFDQSGISGTAVISGNTATYQGDDLVSVNFSRDGLNLTIHVVAEDGTEIESAITDIYSKQ